jgi:O-methyltransferase domain
MDQERFALTPLAEVLRSDVPHSLRAYAIMNGEQWVWQSLGAIEHSVRTGHPAFEHIFGAPLFTYYDRHPEAGRVSREALNSLSLIENAAIVAAYDFPPAGTIVDIGGGQGSLLAAILEARPGVRGVLFERPPVAHAVRTRLAGTPIADQFEAVAGDFFAGIVTYGDLFLLKKIVHDWDDDQARAILVQCRAAMRPDARLLVIEAMLPDDNRPSPAHWLDLLMMVYPGGAERTEAEYRTLLTSAGFSVTRVIPTEAVVSLVEALPS